MKYPKSNDVGPTGRFRCPKCQNSLQNAKIDGSENLERCASCKQVYEPNTFLDINKALYLSREEDIQAQIDSRYLLVEDMVGDLYPSIIDREIGRLYIHKDRLATLTNKLCD